MAPVTTITNPLSPFTTHHHHHPPFDASILAKRAYAPEGHVSIFPFDPEHAVQEAAKRQGDTAAAAAGHNDRVGFVAMVVGCVLGSLLVLVLAGMLARSCCCGKRRSSRGDVGDAERGEGEGAVGEEGDDVVGGTVATIVAGVAQPSETEQTGKKEDSETGEDCSDVTQDPARNENADEKAEAKTAAV
ncbi:hypothetical protein N3K66_007134 [Trichothecium roseum]|uniref:Uncharacterized protein n=1 Tax=Trichothecium roseum TaxID=47278 RepID=A0ACC0UXE4_9HYPO|nr:hypothetical protein N3K66_007134 [Trichothecium roseum]